MRQLLLGLLLPTIALLAPASASADSFEKLLMPGEVVHAHSEFEEDCESCHDTSSKAKQGRLCMQCHDHENILDDITQKRGFHGRLPASLRTCTPVSKPRPIVTLLGSMNSSASPMTSKS